MSPTEEGRMPTENLVGLIKEEAAAGEKQPISGLEAVPVPKEKVEEKVTEPKPEEVSVAPVPEEKVAPEAPESQIEAEKPRTLEEVVEEFREKTAERLTSLLLSPEAKEAEREKLKEFIAQKEKIDEVFRKIGEINQLIEEVERAIAELKGFEPITEKGIRAHGREIKGLQEEKERLEQDLEKVRKEEERWIGSSERREQTRRAYEGWQSLVKEEEARLLQQDEERKRQYEEEEKAAQEFGQRLETWQDYLENEAEIRSREKGYEQKIAVLSGEIEGAQDEKTKGFLEGRRRAWRGQLTRLRKRIPEDVAGFEGEPGSEIEKMYREAMAEMKKIKEGKVEEVEKVEEPKKELSEEEKTAQAREDWKVVMELVVASGAFKENLTDKERKVLEKKLDRLAELSSFPEKIERLRTAYNLPRKAA